MTEGNTVHIRLYPNSAHHAYALDCLRKLTEKRSCSYSQVVAEAIIFYFRELEGISRMQDEERLLFEKSVGSIVDGVKEELSKAIPAFIAGCCITGGTAIPAADTAADPDPKPESVVSDSFSEDDIDWSYLGG